MSKKERGPIRKFLYKVKTETFSFIGLSLSMTVLVTNTLTNYIVPAHPMTIGDGGILTQASTVSTNYWIFTGGLIGLVLLFLYIFLSSNNEWRTFKNWASKF